jgi:hypothetical protein
MFYTRARLALGVARRDYRPSLLGAKRPARFADLLLPVK